MKWSYLAINKNTVGFYNSWKKLHQATCKSYPTPLYQQFKKMLKQVLPLLILFFGKDNEGSVKLSI